MNPERSERSDMRDREVSPFARQPIEVLQVGPNLPQQSCGVKKVTATVGLFRNLSFDLLTIAAYKILVCWNFSVRGEIVLAGHFGEKLRRRCVWDGSANFVYVTNDESSEQPNGEELHVIAVSFPENDVIQYSEGKSLKSIVWFRLLPLHDSQLSLFPSEPRLYQTRQSHRTSTARVRHFSTSIKGNTRVGTARPRMQACNRVRRIATS
jgi:hypothetical protein